MSLLSFVHKSFYSGQTSRLSGSLGGWWARVCFVICTCSRLFFLSPEFLIEFRGLFVNCVHLQSICRWGCCALVASFVNLLLLWFSWDFVLWFRNIWSFPISDKFIIRMKNNEEYGILPCQGFLRPIENSIEQSFCLSLSHRKQR